DHELSPELLRLGVRGQGKIVARDARRKAQIVFDLRARACLAAGGARLHHEDVETLRCSVNGGGEPGRTRAHDHEIACLRYIDRLVEAETIRDLLIARISKNCR